MSRARKYGAITLVAACGALVAGCGGSGGYTAKESAPTGTTAPADGQAAAPATGTPTVEPLGAYATADPALAGEGVFTGFARFPEKRAGTIFVDPTVKKEPAAAPSTGTPVTEVPLSSTGSKDAATDPAKATEPTKAEEPAKTTPTPVTTQLTASMDISGAIESVKTGAQIPASGPAFIVKEITMEKVTLQLISGTMPGGGNTVDVVKGQALSMTNPTTGAAYTIKLVEVKAEV